MPTNPVYLQLENNDDAVSVRDRLTFLRGENVLLVWPEAGSTLSRKLDLVLVQREALKHNIRLAIVSHDNNVLKNARELNLSAFETLGESKRNRWRRGRVRAFASRAKRPKHAPLADDLMPYASRLLDEEERPASRILRAAVRVGVLLFLIAFIIGATVVVVPSATIAIAPAQQTVSADATITADPLLRENVIDVEGGVMPAITIQAEITERGTLPTTGTAQLSSTQAVGTVTFINRTASTVQVPAGALVSTSAGTPIVFRTTADAQVTAGQGQQVDVAVEAIPESSGEIGNVQAGLINVVIGDLASQVEARNLAPTYGGGTSTTRIVTADDRDLLISVLRQQLQDRAFRELTPRVAESQFIIPETMRIAEERSDWMTFDHAVGEAADSLTLTMRAVVAVTAVDEQLARQIVYARLGALVSRGRAVDTNTLSYERGVLVSSDEDGRATFVMSARAWVTAQVDIEALRERLAGMPPDEATAYLITELDLQPDTLPQIVLQPEGLPLLPLLPARIQIQMDGQTASS